MSNSPNDQPAYEPPDPERPATASPTKGDLEQQALSTGHPAHDPYAALRFRSYRLFSLGWMIAVIGNQATAAALGWEIFHRTGSKMALGWLAGVQVIPLMLLALPAGVLADRFDRRRIIQVTAALNVFCSLGLALLSYRPGSVPYMFGLLIASATVLTLGRPARSALLPNIVPTEVFSNAITWNSSLFQLSAMIGPAVGGLLIASSQRIFGTAALPYLFDAVAGLFYVVVMFWIPRPPPRPGHPAEQSALQQLSAGIKFVWQTRIIFATLTLDLFAVLLGGAVYLLPVFAQDILNVDALGFGWLRAGEAIGSFVMAIVIAHLPPLRRAGRSMLLAVALFGVGVIVFGLSRNYWLSLAALVFMGACDNVSVIVRHTLVQVLTPDAMRGRVSAVNNIFIGASNELGGLESGLTAAAFSTLAIFVGYTKAQSRVVGPTWSVVFGGAGTLLTVLTMAILFPQLRKFGSLAASHK